VEEGKVGLFSRHGVELVALEEVIPINSVQGLSIV
jgi:hypothetical protein